MALSDTKNLTETNAAADISASGTLTGAATFTAQTSTAGAYGTFAIDAAGAWTYIASSAHDEFVTGITYTDTFPVNSDVGPTSVTINILGTEDAPTLGFVQGFEADTAGVVTAGGYGTITRVPSGSAGTDLCARNGDRGYGSVHPVRWIPGRVHRWPDCKRRRLSRHQLGCRRRLRVLGCGHGHKRRLTSATSSSTSPRTPTPASC